MRALVVLVLVVAAACGSSPATPPPVTLVPASASPQSSPAASPCDARVDRGVLPEWARAGFSDPEPAIAHVLGVSGNIAAILFGDPLSSPPSADHSNKILWVARPAADMAASPAAPTPASSQLARRWNLEIAAQRMEGANRVGEPVLRTVEGGPGPSTIDLPDAGCWRLTLDWDYRTDTLDLEYAPG